LVQSDLLFGTLAAQLKRNDSLFVKTCPSLTICTVDVELVDVEFDELDDPEGEGEGVGTGIVIPGHSYKYPVYVVVVRILASASVYNLQLFEEIA